MMGVCTNKLPQMNSSDNINSMMNTMSYFNNANDIVDINETINTRYKNTLFDKDLIGNEAVDDLCEVLHHYWKDPRLH